MLTFRRSVPTDLQFITEAIINAERSGRERSLYELVFRLDELGLRKLVADVFEEDLPDSELCLESFIVGVDEGTPVAACAGWIEGSGMHSSNMLKSLLLQRALGAETWSRGVASLKALEAIDIPREAGALQIESVYVHPSYRGRKVVAAMFSELLRSAKRATPELTKAQILSMLENTSSARAFQSAGFLQVRSTRSDSPEIPKLVPGTGRILWERSFPQGEIV